MSDLKAIRYLANLALDYIGDCDRQNVADLNQRIGYCEAVLDLVNYEPAPPTPPEKGGV